LRKVSRVRAGNVWGKYPTELELSSIHVWISRTKARWGGDLDYANGTSKLITMCSKNVLPKSTKITKPSETISSGQGDAVAVDYVYLFKTVNVDLLSKYAMK